jgi:3-hydroxyacyl-CoA dehydrogenase
MPGRYTAKKTVAVADGLMNRVGKVTIVLKREFPDYITNRLQFTLWREAIDMIGRGIASPEDIDSAFSRWN